MERLTIKELAPYLPYDLRMKGRNTEYPLEGCQLDEWFNWGEMTEDKPLLRPLSSLTEERQFGDYWSEIEEIVKESEQHCDAYDEWLEIFIDDPEPHRILQAPFEVVQELLKRNFDVFGLIDRGLALPIEGKEVGGCQ